MDQNAISQLAELTKGAVFSDMIDWTALDKTLDETIDLMALQVAEQLASVKEENQPIVAMATMTKLLVENMALHAMLATQTNTTEK